MHIVRLDGLHLLLRIEEPHPAWRHAALILLDDTVMLATVPLFLVFVAAGARSPARSLILLWSGYYLLMVVVIFHNEIRYRSTLLPFALAGAAGGAALLADPAGRRRAAVRGRRCCVGVICAAGMLSPYVDARRPRRAVDLDAARDAAAAGPRATSPARKVSCSGPRARTASRRGRGSSSGPRWRARDEPVRALDAYRRAEERKAYVWTPRLVRPQLLAEAGLPNADALAEADAFSWHVDPWLALEVAWRALPAPRTDEVLLGPRRLRRRARLHVAAPRPSLVDGPRVDPPAPGRPAPPRTSSPWTWVSRRRRRCEEGDVVVSVDGGPATRIHVGRAVQRYSFQAAAPPRRGRWWCGSRRRRGIAWASPPSRASASIGSRSPRSGPRRPRWYDHRVL